MLRAFKSQLKLLSETNQEEFAKHITERMKSGNDEKYIESAKHLILIMPDLIDHIQRLFQNPKIPSNQKKTHGFILTYLYHPKDFIPWTTHGLFGYLDDAYLTGLGFMKVVQNLDYYSVKESSETLHQFQESVPRWLDDVKQVIPEEGKKIETMLEEIEQNKSNLFEQLFSEKTAESSHK